MNVLDRLGDVFSNLPISSCSALDKDSILESNRQTETINLLFNRESTVFFQSIHERIDVIIGEHILQGKHRYRMLYLRKRVTRYATNLLGGRIFRDPIRMLRFSCFEFLHHSVILVVADLRIILVIVKIRMPLEFFHQGFIFRLCHKSSSLFVSYFSHLCCRTHQSLFQLHRALRLLLSQKCRISGIRSERFGLRG